MSFSTTHFRSNLTNVVYASYGLRGLELIMKEMRGMYPNSPDDEDSNGAIKLPNGFSWFNFVDFVLIPELVGILISEDMGVALDEAFVICEKSTQFGIYAFPELE